MRIIESTNQRAVNRLLERDHARDAGVARRTARIVAGVRANGDAALVRYARRFDGAPPAVMSADEIRRGAREAPRAVRDAVRRAATSIRQIAARQVPRGWRAEPVPGVHIEQRVTPLDRVGCYVPGGRYPLPSSVLMTAIPAAEAGVREIVAVCPRPDAAVLFAADEAGVTTLVRAGGAHAIAALAYGTRTVPRVDKIVGPGNAYVTAANALVAADCAIDFLAGPSEILVLSTTGSPEWIAADLIAQAEHDPDARAIVITPRRSLARAVGAAIARRISTIPAARPSLERGGAIVVTRTLDEAIDFAQRFAPEHAVCDSAQIARRLTRAGTVFIGHMSAQACGDYTTGSNHVLPTGGGARARGGLTAADFVRVTTIQRVTRRGLRTIGPAAITLAETEGLRGHAESIRIRLEGRS
jgi:histidinol dehydrogenase